MKTLGASVTFTVVIMFCSGPRLQGCRRIERNHKCPTGTTTVHDVDCGTELRDGNAGTG